MRNIFIPEWPDISSLLWPINCSALTNQLAKFDWSGKLRNSALDWLTARGTMRVTDFPDLKLILFPLYLSLSFFLNIVHVGSHEWAHLVDLVRTPRLMKCPCLYLKTQQGQTTTQGSQNAPGADTTGLSSRRRATQKSALSWSASAGSATW